MLSLLTISDKRKPMFFEKTIKDSVLFINQTISYPFKILKNNQKKELSQIEKKLKNNYQSELDNLKKQVNELKKELKLQNISGEYSYINASVINRNLGFWYNSVTIDKGSKEGIKENMAVVSSDGLIGKVIKTTRYTSTVKLLTSDDVNNKVSVQIKLNDKYLYGILSSFDVENNEYVIEGVTGTNEIKKGILVSTTGMGDIFPSGILIGEVSSVSKDNFDLEYVIKVKPSINVNNFEFVKVLKKS